LEKQQEPFAARAPEEVAAFAARERVSWGQLAREKRIRIE
jgi:hypothetical protein